MKKVNKIQKDLFRACRNKKIPPNFADVRTYAYDFKKYDVLTLRQIDTVIELLKSANVCLY